MTFLPLETWRKMTGYNPYHFWQQSNSLTPINSSCNTLVTQYSWQSVDAVGRYDIKEAIKEAHHRLREYLGYRVGVEWVEKTIQYPRYPQDGFTAGRYNPVNLGEGYIKSLGVQSYTLLDDAAAVVYSDANSDGVIDTFTITVNTAGVTTDVNTLAVYFAQADRLTNEVEDWRVEPVQITIVGNVATITGPSWMLVRPIIYEGVVKSVIDPNETGPIVNRFAQTLEVRYLSAFADGQTVENAPVIFHYEVCNGADVACFLSEFNCACGDAPLIYGENYTVTSIGGCNVLNIPACGTVRDARQGEAALPAVILPDRVTVRYGAGAYESELREKNIYSGNWQEIIKNFATANFARQICTCDVANKEIWNWQFDLSRAAGVNDEQYSIAPQDLGNPFGTRRGQVYAWQRVKNLNLTRAFSI